MDETTEQTTTKTEPITETTLLHCVMDAMQYQEITKSICALIDKSHTDFRVSINPDGIDVAMVEPANVAMVLINYKKSAFEQYSAVSAEVGFNATVLKNFGKNVKKGLIVSLKITQIGKKINYSLVCDGNAQSGDCVDVETVRKKPNRPIAVKDIDTHITILAKSWIDTIKSAKDISDKIRFISNDSEFLAVAQNGTAKFQKSIPVIAMNGPGANSLFSVDYLGDIVKSIQNKKEVMEISYKTDHILQMTMSNENREITFLLAPRIETD
jgi:DNA polymerase III sliding clamp (beta) subunit (PCNA family)